MHAFARFWMSRDKKSRRKNQHQCCVHCTVYTTHIYRNVKHFNSTFLFRFSIILFFYFKLSAYEFPVIRIANKNERRKKSLCAPTQNTVCRVQWAVCVGNCQIFIDLVWEQSAAATADIQQTFIAHHIGACWLHYVFVLCVVWQWIWMNEIHQCERHRRK